MLPAVCPLTQAATLSTRDMPSPIRCFLGKRLPGRLLAQEGAGMEERPFGLGLGRRRWDHTDRLHDFTEELRRWGRSASASGTIRAAVTAEASTPIV